MPDFPIVDAHVHLYDPARIAYPWMRDVPSLDEAHGPARFVDATGEVRVEAFVFVEVDAAPGAELDEARFVATEFAPREARLRGIVGSLPLERGAAAVAGELAAFAALPLARGVRRLLQGHLDEPGWALAEPFVEAVRSLAAHDLSFDLCLLHPQLAEATELVRRCPEVRFVLDHLGKPGIRDGLSEPWRGELAALAREPNVHCKVSGVVTEADHAHWTRDQVAPYVAHAIECFGFGRVMFGGDWPVATLATDYGRWVDVVDHVVAGASEEERRALYRDNARAFYRLGSASAPAPVVPGSSADRVDGTRD